MHLCDVAISASYKISARPGGTKDVIEVANGPNMRRTATRSTQHTMTSKSTCYNKGQLIFVGEIPVEIVVSEEVRPTFRTPCTSSKFGSIEAPLQLIPAERIVATYFCLRVLVVLSFCVHVWPYD
jgi:hypothetical protein